MNERGVRLERRFEVPMMVAALLVIPAIVIEQSSLGHSWQTAATVLNWVVWAAFAAELVVMVRAVGARWLRDHPLEVAIVALTAPFLPSVLQALRVGRLLRLVRLARLLPLVRSAVASRNLFSFTGLRWATLILTLTILGGGAAFAAAERDQGLDAWDGVWWAMTTATTVGYGDISPKTTAGRVVAMAVMVIAIGFVAMLTAALAQKFVATDVAEVEEAVAAVRLDEAALMEHLREVRVRLDAIETGLRTRSVGPPGS